MWVVEEPGLAASNAFTSVAAEEVLAGAALRGGLLAVRGEATSGTVTEFGLAVEERCADGAYCLKSRYCESTSCGDFLAVGERRLVNMPPGDMHKLKYFKHKDVDILQKVKKILNAHCAEGKTAVEVGVGHVSAVPRHPVLA